MRGIIAKIDRETEGAESLEFLDEAGQSYSLPLTDHLQDAKRGMLLEFTLKDGQVSDCELYKSSNFEPLDVPYTEVKDFAIYRNAEPQKGQEILEQAPFPVEREGRTEDNVKWKLMSFAKKCGANCLIDYGAEQYIKNSIGFSYYMYRAHGTPAVAARLDLKGESTRAELEDKLNEEVLKHEYILKDGMASSKLAFKIVCAVLLVIFCVGFILSFL
ncbi:MAG: hypothetical protein K6F05_06045 [Succinivibrio sp.]|nr:hypothetical protein [Succinivibrio sp.]